MGSVFFLVTLYMKHDIIATLVGHVRLYQIISRPHEIIYVSYDYMCLMRLHPVMI